MAVNVDKPLRTDQIETNESPIEIRVEPPPESLGQTQEIIIDDEDGGGIIIDFDPEAISVEVAVDIDHGVNLAETIDDEELVSIAFDLIAEFETDLRSREPWEKAYTKGLKLLGLEGPEKRSSPWPGAAGVFHPLLIEAIIRFQADAVMETFPAAGPVLSKVIGKETPERIRQAKRVKDDMNYHVTEVIPEYRQEHEAMLFGLPMAGSAFKKTYQDDSLGRPTSRYVEANDFVVSYGTTDLLTCPRATHVIKMPLNDLLKTQYSGTYRIIDIPEVTAQYTDVETKKQKIEQVQPDATKDTRHTILEMHVDYELPGYEDRDEAGEITGIGYPYIISIEKDSQKVLAIYRNWREDDPRKGRGSYFTHYMYLPGLGFYGIGLIHMIGSLAQSATSILRQLIDAGTLANLPGGMKAKGLRIKGDNTPITPGEWRDVDVPGSNIRDSIMPIPYKEPSATLFQLLGTIVEEGRTVASLADLKISDMNQQAPVGTTLAIIERGMKVMSAVNARVHAAMKRELKLLHSLIKENSPDTYEYETDEGATRSEDYDDRVDVLPVSNPNASTMAQRIMQYQAALALSAQAPEIYDRQELHRQMIDVLGIANAEKIVPLEEDIKSMDPVSENMAILNGKPVKAFIYQEHAAHIQAHMAAIEDPKIIETVKKSPSSGAIVAAANAHVIEHIGYQYRLDIEKQMGVQLPPPGEPLPPEIEIELSKLVAAAAGKLLKKDQAEAKAARIAAEQEDPLIAISKGELEVRAADVARKDQTDQRKDRLEHKKIESKERIEGAKIGASLAEQQLELAADGTKMTAKETIEGAKIGANLGAKLVEMITAAMGKNKTKTNSD